MENLDLILEFKDFASLGNYRFRWLSSKKKNTGVEKKMVFKRLIIELIGIGKKAYYGHYVRDRISKEGWNSTLFGNDSATARKKVSTWTPPQKNKADPKQKCSTRTTLVPQQAQTEREAHFLASSFGPLEHETLLGSISHAPPSGIYVGANPERKDRRKK